MSKLLWMTVDEGILFGLLVGKKALKTDEGEFWFSVFVRLMDYVTRDR